ncbi:MAG TPA: serine--tRNA ligase, partial [Prolixibacteraceae bacterium]|jgi:seryl-tRNA synthetase
MLNLKFIQENPELVIERLAVKRFDARAIVEKVIALYKRRNEVQIDAETQKAEMNQLSKEIGQLFKDGKTAEANSAKEKTVELKDQIKNLEGEFDTIDSELAQLQVLLPNLPSPLVPIGKGAEDNLVVATGGEMPVLHEGAKPHWELAAQYDLIDFELGVKITGAGFPVYKGYGARIQRALINFFLDQAREHGYLEVQPPYLVNEASGFGTGQLPDKEGQMYHDKTDNLYLIPTAEVPVTNIFRDVIVEAKDLPIKTTAYSACFRREAGSYGKDVRGLNRLHQFDKVEIVQVAHPDRSYDSLNDMVAYVQTLVEKLGLPYRILRLCGGDMGFTSALTYDFEVWSAAQERWLEVSSVSNFESFQATRLKLRFREEGRGKPQVAHTLNGSALALPRIVAAILENYQTPDGIRVPKVLIPYLGGCEIIK